MSCETCIHKAPCGIRPKADSLVSALTKLRKQINMAEGPSANELAEEDIRGEVYDTVSDHCQAYELRPPTEAEEVERRQMNFE